MELLKAEQEALEFVQHYGIERCNRVLDAICLRFDRRFNLAVKLANVPINREWVMKTPFEVELTHRLKIGIGLADDYFTPEAARQRILKRIAARKLRRQQKQLDRSVYE